MKIALAQMKMSGCIMEKNEKRDASMWVIPANSPMIGRIRGACESAGICLQRS